MKPLALLILVVGLVACGGRTPSEMTNAQDAAPLPGCPLDPAGACGLEGALCEYGSDPVEACNQLFMCSHGTLQPHAQPRPTCPTVDAGVGASCPAYPPPAASDEGGVSCQLGLVCDYPQGRCECATAFPTMNVGFACVIPAAGCSTQRPRLGTPCSQEGEQCSYEACGVSADFGAVTCSNGVWVRYDAGGCPD